MTPSLKPQRHHCADWLYDRRGYRLGDILLCTCNRAYRLREPTLLLAVTFWRGIDAWASGVWVRDRATERRYRKAADHG